MWNSRAVLQHLAKMVAVTFVRPQDAGLGLESLMQCEALSHLCQWLLPPLMTLLYKLGSAVLQYKLLLVETKFAVQTNLGRCYKAEEEIELSTTLAGNSHLSADQIIWK